MAARTQPAGIEGWRDEESRAVLAAMADVAARGPHDDDKAERLHGCCHILAGFNTDGSGEINVAGFEAGMKSNGFGWELMMEVILDFQLGIDFGVGLVGYVPKSGDLDPDAVMVGIRRGLECNTDLMSPEWDFWDDVEEQVPTLRERFGITGVDEVLLDPPEHPATAD